MVVSNDLGWTFLPSQASFSPRPEGELLPLVAQQKACVWYEYSFSFCVIGLL
jgi:hypothetical protein